LVKPPPHSRRDDIVDVIHAVPVADPYRWLENGDDPEVHAWVADNNSRAREALDARPDRSQWHERLVALMQLPVVADAAQRGDRLFVVDRPPASQQFRLVLRSASDPTAEPRVLLDPATLSDDSTTALDWWFPSPNGDLVAYGVSEGGTERSTLRVLRITDGALLDDVIPETRAASVAWLPDASGFYYTRYPDDDEYHRQVFVHLLGTDPADDPLIWGADATPETWPSVSLSRDGHRLLVQASIGWQQVDVHVLDLRTNVWTTVVEACSLRTRFASTPVLTPERSACSG
jgi:prolyl oligopeptidase